jgi:hypothetical protein
MKITKSNITKVLVVALNCIFAYACGNKTEIFAWTKVNAINLDTKINQEATQSSISANEYAIRLQFETGSQASQSSSGGAIGRAKLFNDALDSLEITSLQDFSEKYPRGTILNQLFLMRLNPDDMLPLSTTNFIKTRKREVKDQLELLLTRSPAQALSMRFIVKLNLSYSRTLRDTTDAIILK